MATSELTVKQVEALTDVFAEKARLSGLLHDIGTGDADALAALSDEALHLLIMQVVIDTELVVTGGVPYERWVTND